MTGGIVIAPGKTKRRFVYVSGLIMADGSARFEPFQIITTTDDIATKAKGSYSLSVEDGGAVPVREQSFEPSTLSEHGKDDPRPFGLFVPYDRPGSWIILRHGSQILAERRPSPHDPEVSPVVIEPGAIDAKRKLSWSAKGPGTEALTYSVWYSADKGEKWLPITVGLRSTSWTVDFALLSPSLDGMFRVLASNGFNTTESTSSALQVGKQNK
jgi:hypothetical protein